MKLASYLQEKGKVFVLDEPTDGLHLKDIQHILNVFNQMVEQGNSVFLIEHNLDVIRTADYVIEVGPGGGNSGGEILFTGLPSQMKQCQKSVTAQYL